MAGKKRELAIRKSSFKHAHAHTFLLYIHIFPPLSSSVSVSGSVRGGTARERTAEQLEAPY